MAPKRKQKMMANNEVGEDRLSSLPDALLIQILSLLPTPTAISTSALSRRWRYIWTHLTALDLLFHLKKSSTFNFFTTVDHIIRRLSPHLNAFHLKIPRPSRFDDKETKSRHWDLCSSHLKLWIPQLYARHLTQLVLGFAKFPPVFIKLPSSLFECQSLVLLHLLDAGFDYELPATGITSLPNLKDLGLRVHKPNQRQLLDKLLESCHLLETLTLLFGASFRESGLIIHVSGPNLKRLFITLNVRFRHNVEIAAPKLVYLDVHLGCSTFSFTNIPPTLTEAKISCDWTTSIDRVIVVARGISSVRVLDLFTGIICPLQDATNAANVLPIFHNLTHLTIHMTCDGWKALMFLLSYAPCLEVLVIQDLFRETWDTSDLVPPPCLSTKLKMIEIKRFEVIQDGLLVLKYMLANASVLKSLIVHISHSDQIKTVQLRNELELCEKMYAFPRSSLDCEIRFLGRFVSISSKGIKIQDCPRTMALSQELLLAYALSFSS